MWLLILLWPGALAARTVRIATLADGPADWIEAARGQLEAELAVVAGNGLDITWPDELQRVGDWTPGSIDALGAELLADEQVDLLLTLGPVSSHLMATWESELPRPVIATMIIDARFQGLPITELGGSGRPNLHYLALPPAFRRDINAFRRIVDLSRVGVMISEHLVAAIQLRRGRLGPPEGRSFDDLELDLLPVRGTAADTLSQIPDGLDGVYLGPIYHLPPDELAALMSGLTAQQLPSFSTFGRRAVEAGALAGLGQDSILEQLSRRVALDAEAILRGARAAEMPVTVALRPQLFLNMETARQLDISPGWDVIGEATLINREQRATFVLTLPEAARRARTESLSVRASALGVEAGRQDEWLARSAYLPQIDIGLAAAMLDADQLQPGAGNAPVGVLTGSANLSQLVLAEPVLAAIDAARAIQLGREQTHRQTELDAVLDGTLAWLGVLRTRALEAVYRDNLRITQRNGELAEVREDLGSATPAEVSRWSAEIALATNDVISSGVTRRNAEAALKRLLQIDPQEVLGLPAEEPVVSRTALPSLVRNPAEFERMQQALIEWGLEQSPELASLDHSIDAQQRQLLSARLAFALPTIGVGFGVDHTLAPTPQTGADPFALTFGAQLSFPILHGGERMASLRQHITTAEQLAVQREELAQLLALGIRVAARDVGAAGAAVRLTAQAAEATQVSLDAVSNAYVEGVSGLTDLLNAQAARLNAGLGATNAVYTLAQELLELDRALGVFDVLRSDEERAAFDEFLRAAMARENQGGAR